MTRTTRAQREALKRVSERWDVPYRELRERTHPTIGMDGAVAVQPSKTSPLWLAIEADGYCHS